VFLRHLDGMLALAEVIARGARARDENRGAHYKPAFDPERKEAVPGAKGRDDENWLKTTIAEFTPGGPQFRYEPVDISLVKPRARVYQKAGAASAAATGSLDAVTRDPVVQSGASQAPGSAPRPGGGAPERPNPSV